MIRKMTAKDWPQVKRIYEEGISTGHATFEVKAPSYKEWDTSHLDIGRYVYVSDKTILDWVALSRVSDRCVYGWVAELTVYIAENARNQGIGSTLLEVLIPATENLGYWTLQAGIFPENIGSMELHQKHGFRVVGKRKKLGNLHGVWRDVMLLERRSDKI